MKKEKLCYAVFAACIFVNSGAYAISNQLYVAANYGVAISDKFHYGDGFKIKKPKDAQFFGLGFGYRCNDNVRIELALNRFDNFKYKDTEIDDMGDHYYRQKVNATAIFANAYYDVRKFEKFIPYANIGIGYSKTRAGNMKLHSVITPITADTTVYQGKSKNQFAWNVGVGISYEMNEKFTVDLINYKYYSLGKFSTKRDKVGDSLRDKLKIHSIATGIKINF